MELITNIIELLKYNPAEPMLFNTGLFLVLFVLFILIYQLLLPYSKPRMLFVIAFSLFFYYKSAGVSTFILIGVCLLDYFLGLAMNRCTKDWQKKAIVAANVAVNVGMLIYFKYFNLLSQAFASIIGTAFNPLEVLLPAGISFFTFRSISYIVDLYRGQMQPCTSLLNYTFFLTFFPPLLAGPVVRAKDMLPQVDNHPIITREMISEGLFLIMCGLIKKVVIADYISGNFVDRIFDNPALYSGFENMMGAIGFTIQLYCDFSGYSDMAIGIALLLGYRFKVNFDAPFKAQNPTEFWRRWHISLSTWLRDYIYIPLGGNRHGRTRAYANQMITMLVGGLWHGASWMYVIWGAYHGLLLILHKISRNVWKLPEGLKGRPEIKAVNAIVTFALVVAGFTLFRADSLETVGVMFGQIFNDFHLSVAPQFVEGYLLIVLALGAGLLAHLSPKAWTDGSARAYIAMPLALQITILVTIIFFVIQARQSEVIPFLYLQY